MGWQGLRGGGGPAALAMSTGLPPSETDPIPMVALAPGRASPGLRIFGPSDGSGARHTWGGGVQAQSQNVWGPVAGVHAGGHDRLSTARSPGALLGRAAPVFFLRWSAPGRRASKLSILIVCPVPSAFNRCSGGLGQPVLNTSAAVSAFAHRPLSRRLQPDPVARPWSRPFREQKYSCFTKHQRQPTSREITTLCAVRRSRMQVGELAPGHDAHACLTCWRCARR